MSNFIDYTDQSPINLDLVHKIEYCGGKSIYFRTSNVNAHIWRLETSEEADDVFNIIKNQYSTFIGN